MADVQFENQGAEFGRPPEDTSADFTGKLVGWGLVSTRKEAEYVMIGVVALAIIVAGFLFFRSGSSAPPPIPVNTSGSQ